MSDFGMPPPPPPPPFPSFPSEPPPPVSSRTGPPWEQSGDTMTRFINTVKGVLLDPQATFGNMRREGGLQLPLTFYLIGAVIGALFSVLWALALPGWGGFGGYGGHSGTFSAIFMLPVILICGVIGVFIWSLILHVVLGLFGGQNFPWETTFRVVAYAGGSTAPLSLLPSCLGIIGAVWSVIVLVIGLAQAQETTIGKAAAAVLVPAVLCCGIVFITIAMFVGAAGIAAGWGR